MASVRFAASAWLATALSVLPAANRRFVEGAAGRAPRLASPLTSNVPPQSVVPPLKLFTPASVKVPELLLATAPLLVTGPFRVSEAPEGMSKVAT